MLRFMVSFSATSTATHSSMALKGLPANSPMASVSATVLKDRSPPAAIDIVVHCQGASSIPPTCAYQ